MFVKFLKRLPPGTHLYKVKVFSMPAVNMHASGSVLFLMDYFGYKTINADKNFRKTLIRIPHYKDVPLKIVSETVNYLEKEGFSKEQIEMGFPVVFYTAEILSRFFPMADSRLGGGWRSRENALCLLSYLVEVEGRFTFKLIYDGISDCFNEGMSDNLFKDLSKETETRRKELEVQKREAEAKAWLEDEEYEDDDELFLFNGGEDEVGAGSVPDEPLLQPPRPPLSILSSSLHTSSRRQERGGEGGDKGVVKVFQLENPFTKLKVWLKFREVRNGCFPIQVIVTVLLIVGEVDLGPQSV